MRAKGLGSDVIITEINPTKALEAVMDGFRVMPLAEAAKIGDVFITVTGNKSVVAGQHFRLMKDGAVVANSGHFNVEIDIPALEKLAMSKRQTREFVDEYTLRGGRKIYLLGEGRLINLAAAEGHPAVVMDMSFADQALSAEYVVKNAKKLEPKVYPVPADIDQNVAQAQVAIFGRQHRYPDARAGEVSCLLVGRHVEKQLSYQPQLTADSCNRSTDAIVTVAAVRL